MTPRYKTLRRLITCSILMAAPVLHAQNAHDKSANEVNIDNLAFKWPQDLKQARLITKKQVVSLINSVGYPYSKSVDVEQYEFSVFGDGGIYLVVATNDPETGWFQYIWVIQCHGTSCSTIDFDSAPPIDLNRQIVDLRKDGRHQIVVRECVCLNDDGRQEGQIAHVYEIADGHAKDVSEQYPEYFRSVVLADIAKNLDSVTQDDQRSDVKTKELKAKLLYAQHDAERRVFGDKTAGFSDAQQWEQSNDDVIRRLAVRTYEKIDSPEAETALHRMADTQSGLLKEEIQQSLTRKAAKGQQVQDGPK